ncbi:MAG: AraC family transcriptional regulator [Proteobacteria bacterium]|nr:AraC family transcriptional regulator [Pseudomonadota bacterium]
MPRSTPCRSRPAEVFRPLPCIAEGVLAVAARSARAFPRHSHDQFGIGLILRGAQASASGRGEVESGPGALVTVNPGEVHDGRPIGGARVWTMLYLDPGLVATARAGLAGGTGEEFTRPVIEGTDLPGLFDELYRAATGPAGDAGRMAFDAALGEVVLRLCSGRSAAEPSHTPGVLMARDYLHDRRDDGVRLADLAAAAGLSPFHLTRAFRAAFGLPPHAYLLQLKVAQARRLIASGLPLSRAAAEAGFADQSHLTRIFTRQFGYSPAVFARSQRKNVQDRGRRRS